MPRRARLQSRKQTIFEQSRNQLSKEIGKLMGQGKKDEAEAVKTQVADADAARLAELRGKRKGTSGERSPKIMMIDPEHH